MMFLAPRLATLTLLSILFSIYAADAADLSRRSTPLQSYTLTAVTPIQPGNQMSVSWSAPSGRPTTDWVGLYQVGAPNSPAISWTYTQGAASGTFTPTAPTQVGSYEFRYFLQGGYTLAATSNTVSVAPPVTLTAVSPVPPSGQMSVSWNISSGSSPTDWVGLYKVGDANTAYSWYTYTQGAASGTFTPNAPAQAGNYEFRYLLQGGYILAATSNTVSVVDAPPSISITAPANNSSFTGPANIPITVSASDSDGFIYKVEYFQGGAKIGESTTSPYSFTWNNVGYGSYTLTAKATDNLGSATSSTPVTVNVGLPSSGSVGYAYDETGRLVAVTDATGAAAGYSYDSVGNLLSISRYSSTQSPIVRFSPPSGPVGTTVNLYGIGFSSTASQNTIRFNGTLASVIAANSTQIVTTVPAGATTGPISVTTPSGSATSSSAFTVGAAGGGPNITGFSPTIGATGTTITVNGSNFQNSLPGNRMSMNGMLCTLSSATSSALAGSVPWTGSGHITVSTIYGQAVSSGDFYVTPSGFSPSDVVFTGRTSIGASITATINTANKIGIVLFDGAAGQKVSLQTGNVTIPTSFMTFYKPDGSTLIPATDMSPGNGHTYIDAFKLPLTGTYAILLQPTLSSTGSMTINLYDATDVSANIVPGCPPVTVTTTNLGQNAALFFNGTAGQRVSIQTNSVNFPANGAVLSVFAPDGTALLSGQGMGSGTFMGPITLPTTGTYTIYVDPVYTSTGSGSVTLYNVPADITGTLTIGGLAANITIRVPGQKASLTFTGAAGQQVTTHATGNNILSGTLSLLKPDGTSLTSGWGGGSFNSSSLTLPAAGTYTISIVPANGGTGSISVSVTSP